MAKEQKTISNDAMIAAAMVEFRNDPLGFALWAFPWGQKGTPLEDEWPDRWQIDCWEDIRMCLEANEKLPKNERVPIQISIASGHGIGKALSLNTMVDTPIGRRRWGDIKVGDYLFGRDGQKTKVTHRYDHKNKKMYRVTFDDRTFIECCEDHLWSVRGRNDRRTGVGFKTLSTKDILYKGVKRKNGKSFARQWEIPNVSPVQYKKSFVPVNPYTLGVWLGDGCRNTSRITSNDQEVIDRLVQIGEKVTKEKSKYIYGVSMLKKKLVELGICDRYSYEKYVPVQYMENDIEARSEILRGLLDTDGEVSKRGSIIFSSTSFALANDVIWLARSLGGKAHLQPKTKKPIGHRECFRVTIAMPSGFKSFYIKRKQDRLKSVQDRYLSRWIDSIDPIDNADAMCVTVDAKDHLYVTNDFIVTHNTAFMAITHLWFISTNTTPQIVVTAKTATQLETKTWRELKKWHDMMVHKHLFEWQKTSYYLKESPDTWRSNAISWSANSTEGFAGTHETSVLFEFDEGSAIDNDIYDVTEGAMTTERCIWLVFGNPTRNTGRFKELFGKLRHRWITRHIDARTARKTNKAKIQQWIDDYGINSDFVRVRVLGQFPKQSSNQLISEETVDYCMREFECVNYEMYPFQVCCDVARFGSDLTTVGAYQGAKQHEIKAYSGKNNVEVATLVAEAYRHFAQKYPNVRGQCFVDDIGVGGGVVDILKTWGIPTTGVNSGARADEPDKYVNKRAEMWYRTAVALKAGMDLCEEQRLKDDLTNIEYMMTVNGQKIQIEAVKELKSRGLPSPDYGTNLALRFAYPMLLDIMDKTAQNIRRSDGTTTMQKRREHGYGIRNGRNGNSSIF